MTAPVRSAVPEAIHHAAIYGSDDEFLAVAVPFARGGIAAGEPVLYAEPAGYAAAYLKTTTGSPVATQIWQQPGAIACDLHAGHPAAPATPGRAPGAPGVFDGYRMPDPSQPRADDGLWYARQLSTRLDLRATASGIQARLQLPSARHLAAP